MGTPPSRPRWQRWLAFTVIGALLLGMFAVASSRTERKALRSADAVSVGEVCRVHVFSGQRWMRVNQITLLAGAADGDGAALFVVEGRGWLPRQSASLTVEECESGDVTELGSSVVTATARSGSPTPIPGGAPPPSRSRGSTRARANPHRADRPARAGPSGTRLPSARITFRRHG